MAKLEPADDSEVGPEWMELDKPGYYRHRTPEKDVYPFTYGGSVYTAPDGCEYTPYLYLDTNHSQGRTGYMVADSVLGVSGDWSYSPAGALGEFRREVHLSYHSAGRALALHREVVLHTPPPDPLPADLVTPSEEEIEQLGFVEWAEGMRGFVCVCGLSFASLLYGSWFFTEALPFLWPLLKSLLNL